MAHTISRLLEARAGLGVPEQAGILAGSTVVGRSFSRGLAVQAPDRMGPAETREPGVPRETAWRPYLTFLITLIDVKNAMHVIPGQFVANGHDYRASIPRFVSVAYGLPADDETVATLERVLAERELHWAEKRVVSQEYADASAQVAEQLATWGVPQEAGPPVPAGTGPGT
jgi:hypothetical protein